LEPRTSNFRQGSASALADAQVQRNLEGLYSGFHSARLAASAATSHWDELRDRGRLIKSHVIENLDYYLEQLAQNVERAGGKVFFAEDAKAASDYVVSVAASRGIDMVVKSKSMLSEEMGLNERLESEGIEPVETDLGEYIVQLAGETPFHIIAPAIHKSREQVSDLFADKLGTSRMEDIEELTREARRQLRAKFMAAGMGISGANFLVAESGTVTLVSNEGNGRMCTSMPKVHIAISGMEKVVPSLEDLGLFLRLLIRSATGQMLSSYVTTITGPRGTEEEDGPEEFHLVIVDNGRSRLLADEHLREALLCLRCGACLNACPVYRKVGGHAYGWVYPGPIGAIVSPMLTGLSEGKDLPYASTLRGACKEACPVRIDIPRMLLYMRKELTQGDNYPSEKSVDGAERMAMKAWRASVSSGGAMQAANWVGRVGQSLISGTPGTSKLPGPLSGWSDHRDVPELKESFRSRWRRLSEE
jgi:L-lactate dehydrogenase complex protein LldF